MKIEEENISKSLPIHEAVHSYSKFLTSLLPVGAVFTALGGTILFIYFLQIKYIPPMGVAELALLFTASAAAGMLIFILIGILPFVVSLPWRFLLKNEDIANKFVNDDWRKQFKEIALWCSFPMILIVVLAYLVYTATQKSIPIYIPVFIILIFTYFMALMMRKGLSFTHCIYFLLTATISAAFIAIPFSIWGLITLKEIKQKAAPEQGITLFFVMLVVTVITTLNIKPYAVFSANISEGLKEDISSVVISIAGVLILYIVIGLSSFTNAVVNTLGVGGYRAVSVVLDKNGKITMDLLGVDCSNTTENDYCVVDELLLLWGRGDEYLFRYIDGGESTIVSKGSKQEVGLKFNFTLPRKSIYSVIRKND